MSKIQEKIRITISINKDLDKRIDELIDGVKIRSKSHAIESIIADSLDLIQVRQAVIMLGGEQAIKRLPAIKKILPVLQKYGIQNIYIAVGYLGEKVKKELGDTLSNIKLEYLESNLGTGGSLKELKNKLKKTFLVININEITDLNLKDFLKFHRDHQATVTIATRSLKELQGIYAIEPKIFNSIPDNFCMLEETIFHELTHQGKLLFYPIIGDKSG